ncbi:hypothetical protein RND81_06G088400 [Saponaria officinalis]|uniref:Uncharacterized protein n=1 Tax=Saponaria officinalis TaxID=3572 RepID=A0AAW1K4H3_SAPOF
MKSERNEHKANQSDRIRWSIRSDQSANPIGSVLRSDRIVFFSHAFSRSRIMETRLLKRQILERNSKPNYGKIPRVDLWKDGLIMNCTNRTLCNSFKHLFFHLFRILTLT